MGFFDWFRRKETEPAALPAPSDERSKAPRGAARLRGSEEARKAAAQIKVVASRLANEQLSGDYHSVFKGQGLAFEEVRAYQPGDDVRFIEWNVTARTGVPHIKVFREEREMTVVLVVDRSRGMTFGTVGRSKSQLASVIAGAIAFTAIKNNDRVGLKTMARFPSLDVIRRSRLKKSTLFEMEDSPELKAVQDEYLRLAANLWIGVDPMICDPMKDRDIFDLLGFD